MPTQHPSVIGVPTLSTDLLIGAVEIFNALGDPTRAQLVYLLTNRAYSVNELSQSVGVTPSAVSHHLAKLRAIRLVHTQRQGNQVIYSIDDAHIAALFREALYHLDHVRQNLPDQPYQISLATAHDA
jgi:DNA-binding transcriptional ArsR family regulator